MRRNRQQHPGIYRSPEPVKVAEIVDGYGLKEAFDRWHWLSDAYIKQLARRGRRIKNGQQKRSA